MGLVRTVSENLAGAWQVMLGRPEGLNRLDTSIEGFWRSFAAVVLLLPFALVGLVSQGPIAAEGGAPPVPVTGGGLLLSCVALLVDWVSFPAVFALIARPFGLASRYVPFIVTRNWASVIIVAVVGIVHVLHIAGAVPTAVMPYVLLVATVVALRFFYVIARTTLAVSFGMALPIVLLDLLISLTVWSAFDRFA